MKTRTNKPYSFPVDTETVPTMATPVNNYVFAPSIYKVGDGDLGTPYRRDAFDHLQIKSFGTPA
jgi:hypothetical protein